MKDMKSMKNAILGIGFLRLASVPPKTFMAFMVNKPYSTA